MKEIRALDEIGGGYWLVDFYADWCQPCRMLSPVLEDIEKDFPSVTFAKHNVDTSDIAESLSIFSIPTVILFRDGEEVDRFIGALDRETIVQWIEDRIEQD